jgi:hypothetical protein
MGSDTMYVSSGQNKYIFPVIAVHGLRVMHMYGNVNTLRASQIAPSTVESPGPAVVQSVVVQIQPMGGLETTGWTRRLQLRLS